MVEFLYTIKVLQPPSIGAKIGRITSANNELKVLIMVALCRLLLIILMSNSKKFLMVTST